MWKTKQLIQLGSVVAVAVAGAAAAAWLVFGSRTPHGSQALGGAPSRHCPFDPVAAAEVTLRPAVASLVVDRARVTSAELETTITRFGYRTKARKAEPGGHASS